MGYVGRAKDFSVMLRLQILEHICSGCTAVDLLLKHLVSLVRSYQKGILIRITMKRLKVYCIVGHQKKPQVNICLCRGPAVGCFLSPPIFSSTSGSEVDEVQRKH